MIPDWRFAEDIAVGAFNTLWNNRSRVTDFQSIRDLLFVAARDASLTEMHNSKDLRWRYEGFPGDGPESTDPSTR